MILVTVGTQLPFDRLVRAVDTWAAEHPDVRLFAQIGIDGSYTPVHLEHARTLSPPDLDQLQNEADLIVGHAGTGTIFGAMERRKPVIIMPRRADLGEHRNDHQVATARHFASRQGIHVVYEAGDLGPAIDAALSRPDPMPPVSPDADAKLIATVRRAIWNTPEG